MDGLGLQGEGGERRKNPSLLDNKRQVLRRHNKPTQCTPFVPDSERDGG